MRLHLRIVLLSLCCFGYQHSTKAFADLLLDNVTMTPSSTAVMNVVWNTTTRLNYLSTEFLITTGTGGVAAAVQFSVTSGAPPIPPLSDTNYVFYSNSLDFTLLPSNPASVSASGSGWTNDTYSFTDSTADDLDYIQSGSRLWTILNIETTGLAAGVYQVSLNSGQHANEENPSASTSLLPTYSGGTITIVPEPRQWLTILPAISLLTFVLCRQNR